MARAKTTGDSNVLRVGARDRVLAAARAVFEEQGYTNASLNDILAAAGVSSSNFYYHFESKEDLGLAFVRELTERLEAQVVREILQDRARTPFARLRAYLDMHREKLASNNCSRGCAIGKLAAELSDSHPLFREEIEKVFQRIRDSLRETIREGIEQGELRRGIDPANASTLVVATVQGLTLLAKSQKCPSVFEQGAAELVRLLAERI